MVFWWDQEGVIYYELLKSGETVTKERYRQQLVRLSDAIKEKRQQTETRHERVIFDHDNTRPHIAKVVQEELKAQKWEVLPHSSYSPDIAPSDYHLFRTMQNDLAGHHFQSYQKIENWVGSWIRSKDKEFFRSGIRNLPERWAKVVANDGQYFE